MKKYHFIAGLPRAGTTLLATILKQNPKFETNISGPLARFVKAIIEESSAQGGYRLVCPPEKRKKIINGLFENYYDDPSKEVAWSTNRGWPLLLPVIKDLYPSSKIILCVRDIGDILNSFELLFRKNPYSRTLMFSNEEGTNVYSRSETLLSNSKTIGFAYAAVKQALVSEHKNSIFLLEYENLAKQPELVMKALYKFVNEPYFEHDFNNVESSFDEFDNEVQLPGLHTTRKKVEFIKNTMVIPPDILSMVSGMSVWKKN